MRQGLAAVLLCVVMVTAGCSALPGSGNGNGNGATAEEVPGVEDGQLVNESALLDAHVETITETGYSQEIRANFTTVNRGETVEVSSRQRTSVAAGATEYRYQTITDSGISSRILVWGNESVAYQRGETGGGDPQYQSTQPESEERLAGRVLLEDRISSEFEVVDVEQREDAPDVVTLSVDELPEDSPVFENQEEIENIRQFEAELVVDTEGRIHSYAAAAVYDVNGTTAEYDFSFQMTNFEDPGVEKPEWAEQVEG